MTKGQKFMEFSGDREDPNIIRSFLMKKMVLKLCKCRHDGQ